MTPNPVEARRELARRVTDQLVSQTELRVALLTGSVAASTCDQHSDIDLLNYYDVLPSREVFDLALERLGAGPPRDLSSPGAAEFLAGYTLDGIEVQTGAQLVSSMEVVVDAIAAGEVSWATAKVAMGLQEGVALHGASLLDSWRERIRYPEALRRREIEANIGFFPIWRLAAYLESRDAALFQREMLLDGGFRVLAVLSALNGLYFSRFQFKRSAAHAARMAVKPDRLAERLNQLADDPAGEAAQILRELVAETRALVGAEMPDLELDQPWRPSGPDAA